MELLVRVCERFAVEMFFFALGVLIVVVMLAAVCVIAGVLAACWDWWDRMF